MNNGLPSGIVHQYARHPRLGINYDPKVRVGIGGPRADGSTFDVHAGLVVKPPSHTAAGLVVVITDPLYGTVAGKAGYGSFPFAIIDKTKTETILGGSIRFYVTANGDLQSQGWQHLATGLVDPTWRGDTLPNQAQWIQPGIDIFGTVITQPAGGTKNLLQITNSASSLIFLKVDPTGYVASSGNFVGNVGTEQVAIGSYFGVAGVTLGNAGDTAFYRSAASSLAISGRLIVANAAVGDIQQTFQQKASQTGDVFRVLTSGAATVAKMLAGGTLLVNAGSQTVPALANNAETGTGVYFTAGAVGFTINGALKSYQTAAAFALIDGVHIFVGSTNGTKIATTATEKLGFFGATPVVRPAGVAVTAAGVHAALTTLGLIAA